MTDNSMSLREQIESAAKAFESFSPAKQRACLNELRSIHRRDDLEYPAAVAKPDAQEPSA